MASRVSGLSKIWRVALDLGLSVPRTLVCIGLIVNSLSRMSMYTEIDQETGACSIKGLG
jgi:hypothetical protein